MATIKIEVTYDPKEESLNQALASLLNAKPEITGTPMQMSLFNTPALTDAPHTVPEANAVESVANTIEPEAPAKEEKTISQADVRALAVALSKTNKPALKAIFKELGVASFSAVKEEDYPVFYEKLVAANG